MLIFEITLNDGEVFVSSNSEISGKIETQVLENNIYGQNLFLKNRIYYHFTENGPKLIHRTKIVDLFFKQEF